MEADNYVSKPNQNDLLGQKRIDRLESIVECIGETVIAATETVERLAEKIDLLAVQIQQQSYQNIILKESLQILADINADSHKEMRTLTTVLQDLIAKIDRID